MNGNFTKHEQELEKKCSEFTRETHKNPKNDKLNIWVKELSIFTVFLKVSLFQVKDTQVNDSRFIKLFCNWKDKYV